MSFGLIPKSVTLNDLERRNSPNWPQPLRNFTEFGSGRDVKVVEDTLTLSSAEM